MTHYSTVQFIFILTPFAIAFAFGLDIYIPVVPQIAKVFNASASSVQLTLSLFLFATGLGQLFIGPFSDRFGRKAIFYASSITFAVGSLVATLSPSIAILILGRAISGFGAAGMLVAAYATVRDLFHGQDSARMYSFLSGAIGISPTFAPIIGSYLGFYFGWRSVFLLLTILGCVAFFNAYCFIAETATKSERIMLDRNFLNRYWHILRNREFFIHATLAGLAQGVLFGFLSLSPFVVIDHLGISPTHFGYIFAVFGGVLILSGVASGYVMKKVHTDVTILSGIVLMLLGGVSSLIAELIFTVSLAGFLLPMILTAGGSIFLFGSATSSALEPFAKTAGTASALLGAWQFVLASLIGSIVVLFPTTTTLPYNITIIIAICVAIILFRLRKTVI